MWQQRLPVLFEPDLFKDKYSVHVWRRLTATTLNYCYILTSYGLVEENSCKDFESSVRKSRSFLRVTGHAKYKKLNDGQWLLDLAFSTDLTNMLNDLSLKLQGKNKGVMNIISSVNAFKRKMQHLCSKLQCHCYILYV